MDMDPLTSLQVCMLNLFSCVWLCVTLWTIAPQVPLSMEFSWQEYWSGLPWSPPGDLPHPGIEPMSLMSPALAGRFFTTSTTWGAPDQITTSLIMSSFLQIIWSKENFKLEFYYLALLRAEIFECGSNAALSQRPYVSVYNSLPLLHSIFSLLFFWSLADVIFFKCYTFFFQCICPSLESKSIREVFCLFCLFLQ